MKYLNLLFLPIRRNYRFFVFIFLLLMLCATVAGTGYRKEIFFDVYILCALLALLPYKIRLWVSGGIAALQYLTAIVDIYYFDNFGATLNPAVIMLLNETNFAEASDFLQTFMSVKVLFGHIAWILLLLALHITAFVERKRISKLMHSLANEIISKIGCRKYQLCKAAIALPCMAIIAWGGRTEHAMTSEH